MPEPLHDVFIAYASPEDAVETAGVKALFQGIVDEVNRELDGFERIKKFALLPKEFTAEADELTFTLKVKRRVINDRYRRVIDTMYE